MLTVHDIRVAWEGELRWQAGIGIGERPFGAHDAVGGKIVGVS